MYLTTRRALRLLRLSGGRVWLHILSAEQLKEYCVRVCVEATDGTRHLEQPAKRQTVPKPGPGPGPGGGLNA